MGAWYAATAFGLRWRSDSPLAQFTAVPDDGTADVTVEYIDALPARRGGEPINHGRLYPDGIRFRFGEAVFDMFDGRLVRWSGPTARGLSIGFYGTVTGLLLAWRGLAPIHGSAVALGGAGVLIAGHSGAGKSTLCHALAAGGGRLISDDLSALLPMTGDAQPLLQPGRPAIRLVGRGADKQLVTPPVVPQDRAVPLTHLILLRDMPLPPGPAAAAATLAGQQFRPRWMRRLPGAAARTATLFRAAQRIAIHVLPPATATPDIAPEERAALVAALVGGGPPMDTSAGGQ